MQRAEHVIRAPSASAGLRLTRVYGGLRARGDHLERRGQAVHQLAELFTYLLGLEEQLLVAALLPGGVGGVRFPVA